MHMRVGGRWRRHESRAAAEGVQHVLSGAERTHAGDRVGDDGVYDAGLN